MTKDKELKTTTETEAPKSSFLITVILSICFLIAYKHFIEKPKKDELQKQQQEITIQAENQDEILSQDKDSIFYNGKTNEKSIVIETPNLQGELSLKGNKIDNLTLTKYFKTVDQKENIKLLNTGSTPYFIEYGWNAQSKNISTPDKDSEWSSDVEKLTTETPATLTWDNGKGLIFIKKISIDNNYMFSVEQSVKNETGKSFSIIPYTRILKEQPAIDKKEARYQQGAIGSIDNIIEQTRYPKIKKTENTNFNSANGWFGFSDKYWLTSYIFDKESDINVNYQNINQHNIYEIVIEGESLASDDGKTVSNSSRMFVGPKELKLLDTYMTDQNIPQFDKAIDFGWYYFLTKPFYYILEFLGSIFHNMGLAILAFTIMLRIAMFPIANKSYASMNKMRLLQPKIKAIKEKYGQDKQKMQKKTMELYQKEKISPMGGCLPMLMQIPIFFSFYKVISISIEMRQAPFFGWIQDLSIPDPTNLFTAFGLINWNPPALLAIGIWPLLMGITMFLQQKINPKPEDKSQAMAFMMMPIVFTFMLAKFASGLVIYWTFSNCFAIAQQWIFIKLHGVRK